MGAFAKSLERQYDAFVKSDLERRNMEIGIYFNKRLSERFAITNFYVNAQATVDILLFMGFFDSVWFNRDGDIEENRRALFHVLGAQSIAVRGLDLVMRKPRGPSTAMKPIRFLLKDAREHKLTKARTQLFYTFGKDRLVSRMFQR
ncbi:hypothetical protein ACFL2D_00020 [Patescibacteria group bacterium]